MDSPSSSTWSEPCILSDDSGLRSLSSGRFLTEMNYSDCDVKSLSQADSLDGMSDIVHSENFNTLKKGPHCNDTSDYKLSTPIDPPFQFQDKPNLILYKTLADSLMPKILSDGIRSYCRLVTNLKPSTRGSNYCSNNIQNGYPLASSSQPVMSYWTSDFLQFGSPPSSSRSLVSSRLSSSHNSLSVPTAQKVDDSSFITQAVSHDVLVGGPISDMYNVPFDSDMYAVPVDVIKHPFRARRIQPPKRRRRNTSCCHEFDDRMKQYRQYNAKKYYINYVQCNHILNGRDAIAKRHSVAASSTSVDVEPVQMTLQQVRHYLQTLYSSSSDSSLHVDKDSRSKNSVVVTNNNKYSDNNLIISCNGRNSSPKFKKSAFLINLRNKRVKDSCDLVNKEQISVTKTNNNNNNKTKKSPRMSTLKQTLCNIFKFKKIVTPNTKKPLDGDSNYVENVMSHQESHKPITNRALPPLPYKSDEEEQGSDFSTSIQKVKDYGWYWGPISSEAAEKVLSNEPDGSFIVRDSSDDHYIFSLTLKLNNSVRHVRIEHDQGNFSFGSCTKFKSQTIVEFIENAVEHSRSGRYLFFLHRRPVIGPVRVQLLHPVSRFKQVQSLQHMCRFVILKLVRRDLLCKLPLPRRMIDYLNTQYYYSEQLSDVTEEQEDNNVVPLFSNAQITQNTVVIVNNNAIMNTTRSNPSGTSNSFSNDRQS